jgi:hypothetical protein
VTSLHIIMTYVNDDWRHYSSSFLLTPPHSSSFLLTPPHSSSLLLTPPHSSTLLLTPPQKSGPNGAYITTNVKYCPLEIDMNPFPADNFKKYTTQNILRVIASCALKIRVTVTTKTRFYFDFISLSNLLYLNNELIFQYAIQEGWHHQATWYRKCYQ